MQIQKVQSNQTTFGTKVKIDPFTARQMSLSGASKKILQHIKALEGNGINDTLFLSYERGEIIRASVLEQKDGKNYVSQYNTYNRLRAKEAGKRSKFINITNLYNEAKKNMTETVINKNGFEKFLAYIN